MKKKKRTYKGLKPLKVDKEQRAHSLITLSELLKQQCSNRYTLHLFNDNTVK